MRPIHNFRPESIRQAKELARSAYLQFQESGSLGDDFRFVFPKIFSPVYDQFDDCTEVIYHNEYLKEDCIAKIIKDIQRLVSELERIELTRLYNEVEDQFEECNSAKPKIIHWFYAGDAISIGQSISYEYLVSLDSDSKTAIIHNGYRRLVSGETQDIITE